MDVATIQYISKICFILLHINSHQARVHRGLLDVLGDARDEGLPVLEVGVEVGPANKVARWYQILQRSVTESKSLKPKGPNT